MCSPISLADLSDALCSKPIEFVRSEVDLSLCVESVVVDSREVRPGSLFVARVGDSLDGHDYLESALLAGAQGAVVEEDWYESEQGAAYVENLRVRFRDRNFYLIPVEDSTRALGRLARFYANRWRERTGGPIVAITGSVGKSTAKEYVAQVLKQLFGEGAYSKKSFNNHIGLPLTILSALDSDRWMVLEAGMNHPGELTYLGVIAEPDILVLLNVGPVHLEFFDGDISKIADAKCELLAQTRHTGTAWINADSGYLIEGVNRLQEVLGSSLPQIKYFSTSSSPNAELRASDVRQTPDGFIEMKVELDGDVALVRLPQWGVHNADNALAAVAVAQSVYAMSHEGCVEDVNTSDKDGEDTQSKEASSEPFKLSVVANALSNVRGIAMRFEGKQIGKTLVINDAYNANPLSVSAALKTAKDLSCDKSFAVVLGDMLELGSESAMFHRQIGAQAASLAPCYLICMGKFARDTIKGARQSGFSRVFVAESYDEIISQIEKNGVPDVLLVKASRGMAFENVVTRFEEKFGDLSSTVLAI